MRLEGGRPASAILSSGRQTKMNKFLCSSQRGGFLFKICIWGMKREERRGVQGAGEFISEAKLLVLQRVASCAESVCRLARNLPVKL